MVDRVIRQVSTVEANTPNLALHEDYTPYPAYKPSGVEWLGEIPAHWKVRRLKSFTVVQLSNVDKKSTEGQEAVRLCNYTDVYYREHVDPNVEFMPATATKEQVRRFSLRAGDVLITKDSEDWADIAVPAVVTQDLPGVLCGYHLALIRPDSRCDGAFLSRVIAAIGPRDQYQLSANGITRYGLTGDSIRASVLAFPPLAEQRAIAAFLDRETAKIDALVAKKERLIELLQEKRAALISRAVTKGLDPNVPTKDSGVEWLGEIPAHWKVTALRRLTTQVTHPLRVDSEQVYREIGIRSWGKGIFHKDPIQGVHLGDKRVFNIRPGELVLNIVFAWEGAVAVVSEGDRGMIASHRFPTFQHISTLVHLDYLLMFLQSEHGRALMGLNSPGAAGRNRTIRIDAFLNEEVSLPPLKEQQEIVSAFRKEEQRLQSLSAKIREAIDRLKELRAALISAAVTGRIDVREEAA